eukprot:TRINITY_DN852_c0_g3_i1.p1 TRINITY_DN852_c0_g3~~TRINITY_DN852_c0_g3_i1.p1  ORF type:complete len:269 (+),score=53.77 TRINITY_DN852_c0_g3_i1:56-808(+)
MGINIMKKKTDKVLHGGKSFAPIKAKEAGKKVSPGKVQEEEKVIFSFKAQGPYTEKPSAKYTSIKTADPFANTTKKHKTTFGYVYTSGSVPCRIQHGGVNNFLLWDKPPVSLIYDPLLQHCFEGIMETEHPYAFVAFQALRELLQADGAAEKTIPQVPKLMVSIKTALMSSNPNIYSKGLDALQALTEVVGENVTSSIHLVLAQLSKGLTNKKFKQRVTETLTILEEQGGPEIIPLIKSKIPTYAPNVNS